ncbi:MAG: acyl-CoA/acyl-ACP dehydrogenase [Fimbriimonadaceae bacterium]|nr:acyl-CoA/acyl-ACP dehydrogenase [Fimbriimonadaceae bacterium]QYK56124.1 MAG: acyl-CoA/acyl-ACP dehydrogenase [Fimbriimonadaceae bacterium]
MHPVVEEAVAFLKAEVAPKANEIDRDPEALRQALQGLCERGLMALRRPAQFGGPGLAESEFRTYQEAVARASGTLAFLQTQHQSAGSMIAKSENAPLKEEALPKMGNGERLIGIGFSQLRRHGEPVLRAEPVEGGYRLDGHVPWITGYGFYPEFLIGATLPDGRAVFGIVPFTASPGISFSEPMRLAAMEAAMTVTAELNGLHLPASHVVFKKPAGWIHENDQINVTLQGFFAIGCAQAGIDVTQRNFEKKGMAAIGEAAAALQLELEECRRATNEALGEGDEGVTNEEKLRLRAWAIDLAVRCAHAAVTSSSGAANSIHHDAQRIYREALVFTVSAQTGPIMAATLDRLAARSREWPSP